MSDELSSPPDLIESSKKLLSNAVNMFKLRTELIGIEILEEKSRLLKAIIFTCGALISITLFLMVITFSLIFFSKEAYRMPVIGILLIFYLGLGSTCMFVLLKLVYKKAIFSSTISELKKDQECLN
ncbi:MAG: hypothetical protein A2202_00220 [Bdellovibrionales bacterium RIFOXYA1_FULL_36_14]|nr:MAG: hypothetical protein A2202_00220 [Bdellovibrionales bacterium RIFOXYA1_FULL_36_14]